MKQPIVLSLVFALFVAIPLLSHAQSSAMKGMEMKDMDMKGMDMKGMESGKKEKGAVHKGVGVVKKVDAKAGTVTLDHEPIKSMNWSAMTMSFVVKDKKLLEKLKDGKKVEFEFVQQGKDNVLTAVQ